MVDELREVHVEQVEALEAGWAFWAVEETWTTTFAAKKKLLDAGKAMITMFSTAQSTSKNSQQPSLVSSS